MPSEIDPDERLFEGWEPSPVPARTPNDPLPAPTRVRLPQVPAPTLCEQGPCSHYHMAVVRFDAATPMDGSDDVTHTQTLRTCIPGPGVTLELEDKPVFECSLWEPDQDHQNYLEQLRERFATSEAGRAYERKLAEWRADQDRIRKEMEDELLNPPPDLSVLDAMIAELQPGDVLELRVKGKPEQLGTLTTTSSPELRELFTEAGIVRSFGPNTYQLRRVNSAGAIVSTRLYTIEPTTTETPTP